MSRMKLILIIVATALLSCAVTSAFWFAAFNSGAMTTSAATAVKPVTPAAAPGDGGAPKLAPAASLVLGPTGLAVPVVGVKREQLTDTFTQARSGGRVHDAID